MTDAPQPQPLTAPEPRRPWYKKWWVWAIVGVLVIAGVIQQAAGGGSDAEPEAATPTASQPAAAEAEEPSDEPEPEQASEAPSEPPVEESDEPAEEAEPAAPETSLADEVWERVVAGFGGSISSESPLFAVTEVEDMGASTMRVYVQQNLADDGREMVARHVFNLGAMDDTRLGTIVVRDASGIDSNHYRRDFPHLPQ